MFWDDKNRKILRHCDVTFDEVFLYKDREQKVLEITKQVGVEVELEKSNPRDVEADTQPTPTEESEVERVTPEHLLIIQIHQGTRLVFTFITLSIAD